MKENETVGQAAERMWPGVTFDYALPQRWVNEQTLERGWDPRGQVVWAYTLECNGFPLPLTVEAAFFLIGA